MNSDGGPDLIPRRVLFGNSKRNFAKVSPEGTRLAFLAPLDGVMNVWVAPAEAIDEARAVTGDDERGIGFYIWPRCQLQRAASRYFIGLEKESGVLLWKLDPRTK